MIKVEIKGYEDFVNKVGHMVVDPYVNSAIKKSIQNFERTAIQKTPRDNGNLANSYQEKFGNLEGSLINTREYGLYVHEGTGIYARNGRGRKTRWFFKHTKGNIENSKGERGFFTRGQKPQPWMEETVQQEQGKVEVFFNKEMDKLFQKLQ